MSRVIYTDQTPDRIQAGDMVTDSYGRRYEAQTSAEREWTGEYAVLAPGMKWISYEPSDLVTLEFEHIDEYA